MAMALIFLMGVNDGKDVQREANFILRQTVLESKEIK